MPFTVGSNHSLMNRHYYNPRFTEEETEAQRDELTCQSSHNLSEAEPGFEPRTVWSQSPRSKWAGVVYVRASAGPGSEAANLPQSHVDSDSSSSHSRQETPPTTAAAAAAPMVTVESASGFGPVTPPQRRRSSAQVGPPTPSRSLGLPTGHGGPEVGRN